MRVAAQGVAVEHRNEGSNIAKFCFGLRFGGRESGVGAERRQERSRNGTTVAVPQAEARRSFGIVRMPLVTNALLRNGTGMVEGDRADRQPVR